MFKKVLSILVMSTMTCAQSSSLDSAIAVPTKVVIPFNPGGGVDSIFRLMQKYAEQQQIILIPDYRPGGNGQVGVQHAANDSRANNTLLLTIIGDVAKHTDKIKPVSALAKNSVLILASNGSKIDNINQLQSGGHSWGYGSSPMEEVARGMTAHTPNSVLVPFNGAGPVTAALISNTIDIAVVPTTAATGLLNSKYVKVIAVYDDFKNAYPNIPKVEDHYKINLENNGFGLFAPAGAQPKTIKFWEEFSQRFVNDYFVQIELRERGMYTMKPNHEYLTQLVKNFGSRL